MREKAAVAGIPSALGCEISSHLEQWSANQSAVNIALFQINEKNAKNFSNGGATFMQSWIMSPKKLPKIGHKKFFVK